MCTALTSTAIDGQGQLLFSALFESNLGMLLSWEAVEALNVSHPLPCFLRQTNLFECMRHIPFHPFSGRHISLSLCITSPSILSQADTSL
jgi:hypothetical protein